MHDRNPCPRCASSRCGTLISACMAGVRELEASLCLHTHSRVLHLHVDVHTQADETVRAETTRKPTPCTVTVADGDTSHGLANLEQSLHKRFSKARVAADPRVRPRCARQTGSRGWSVAAFEKQTGGGDQGRKVEPAEEGERSFIVSCPDARLRP